MTTGFFYFTRCFSFPFILALEVLVSKVPLFTALHMIHSHEKIRDFLICFDHYFKTQGSSDLKN